MPIHPSITAISGLYPDIARNSNKYFLKEAVYIYRHFLPNGEPI